MALITQPRDRESALILFEAFRDGSITVIVPEFDGTGACRYPLAEKITSKNSDDVRTILDSMVENGLLLREEAVTKTNCPECGSNKLAPLNKCPNCGGLSMKSGEVLEHLSCLHVDFEDTFPKIDGLVICPKCNRELKTLGSDYLRPGLLYKCLGCGDFTVTRKITFECRECGKTFDQPKIGLVPYYKYKLNPKGDADPHEAQSQDLSVLANRLESSGWQVRMNATVPGKSGVNHYFSMYLTLQEKKRKETCVVEVAKSDFEINTTPVLAFFAKALDVGAKHKVLLATPKLTPTAKKLASSYNMTIIESSDETRMVDNVWQALSSTSRHLQKSTKQPSLGKRRSLDIIADILAVSSQSVSKTEIMGRVNLSYEQCQKYIPMLEKLEFLRKYFEDGIHVKYAVTDKGRQYLLTLAGQFGTIVEGERSVWDARRSPVPT